MKYPRTYHFPFSLGSTSDDKITDDFSNLYHKDIVITEKLDGENTCINQKGIFARSHVAPTQNPWANYLWEKWNILNKSLGNLELFGESLFAIHSLEYTNLHEYFYLFAIRENETWLSWKEVEEYSEIIEIPTVPVLFKGNIQNLKTEKNILLKEEKIIENLVVELVNQPSTLSDIEIGKTQREGIVARVADTFENEYFSKSVFKWVRKNHIQTDEHWSKKWKKAKLNTELKAELEKKIKALKKID